MADAELLGIPHRILVTEKGIDAGALEYKGRGDSDATPVAPDAIVDFLKNR